MRQNLDPFDQYDDAVLNAALRSAGLFSLQGERQEDRITLDSSIASGGGNLSVNQRQILALARAMVRGSKLVVLDEGLSITLKVIHNSDDPHSYFCDRYLFIGYKRNLELIYCYRL